MEEQTEGYVGCRNPDKPGDLEAANLLDSLPENGKVWPEIVDKVDKGTLLPLIAKRREPGSIVCSDT
jgi:hypothetical protein